MNAEKLLFLISFITIAIIITILILKKGFNSLELTEKKVMENWFVIKCIYWCLLWTDTFISLGKVPGNNYSNSFSI